MTPVNSIPPVVPIVAPISNDPSNSGRVLNLRPTPQITHKWLERSKAGAWIIRAEYRDAGWRMLREIYESEGDEEGWVYYKRYLEKWAAGTTRVSFPKDRLPKEVQHRQACGHALDHEDEFARPPTTGKISEPKAPKMKAAP